MSEQRALIEQSSSGEALRTRVLDGMVRALRVRPLHEVDCRIVADEADVGEDELLGLFPSWDSLLLATIDYWAGGRNAALMPIAERFGTVRFLRAIVAANIADPSLMRFLTSTLSISATPEHKLAPMLHGRWRRFYAFVQDSLERDIRLGREPGTMDPTRGAEQLISSYEGLQLQSMVRSDMDLLDSFDRAVTRLREGWSQVYVAPVWELDVAG